MFSGGATLAFPSKMAAGRCRTVIARAGKFFFRVQAPGNPAGHFFVAGQFDEVCSTKYPKSPGSV